MIQIDRARGNPRARLLGCLRCAWERPYFMSRQMILEISARVRVLAGLKLPSG